MVAAAIVGGALVAGVGTAVAGSEAAGATQSASNAAIAEQQQALGQQAQLSAPYRALGEAAIPQYEALLGITPQQPAASPAGAGSSPGFTIGPNGIPIPISGGGAAGGGAGTPAPVASSSASSPTIQQALEATPGYQFTKQQGQLGITNLASTQGGVSGNTLAALDTFNTGLASETYQQNLSDIASAVGSGQAAAAGQAQNIGTAASNIGNIVTNQGQVTAGIDANTVAGITKSIGNAGDQYLTLQALNALNNQVPPGG